MPKRATLRDVAAAAGVSPTTASFVLNDTPGQTIPEATRSRVHAAAAELAYVPHGVARALREGSSRVVLLDTADIPHGPSLEAFTAGLSSTLAEHGHTLLVHPAAGGDLARTIADVRPRAVIDLGTLYGPDATGTADGGWSTGLAAHTSRQIEHLATRGHRVIAFAIPEDPKAHRLAELRLRHAAEAAEAQGARLVPLALPSDDDQARAAAAALLRDHPDVTAAACYDDTLALRLLVAMHHEGRSAPDDLAVIGFDGGQAPAPWLTRLTTVAIDATEYGRRAAFAALGIDPGPRPSPVSQVTDGDTA